MRRFVSHLDVGHIGFLLLAAILVRAYLYDVIQASSRLENLILIVPVSTIVLLLCVGLIVAEIFTATHRSRVDRSTPTPQYSSDESQSRSPSYWHLFDAYRKGLVMAVFTIYVLSLMLIPVDLATFLFLAGCIYILGERSVIFLILYPALFSGSVTVLFTRLLPYPIETLLP
jgi:hypothetical protein